MKKSKYKIKPKTFIREMLVKKIYKRMGGVIPYKTVYYAVGIIINKIIQEIIDNHTISIKRFGTLSPYFREGHRAYNYMIGEIIKLPNMPFVKFYPHEDFISLIKENKDKFSKNVKVKTFKRKKIKKKLDQN